MGNYIDKLTAQVTRNRDSLRAQYHHGQLDADPRLAAVVQKHWHPLPVPRAPRNRRPAYAVDGSNRRASLSNGSTLFVAQGLIVGEGVEETNADVEILPGTVEAGKLDRFADLMRQNLEIALAREFAGRIEKGSILYLDGTLHGALSQLYPLENAPRDPARELLEGYTALFDQCRTRNIYLISIAKTNRQPLFSELLPKHEGIELGERVSDSAFFAEWTGNQAGYVTPVLLGDRGFSSRAKEVILDRGGLKEAPALVSFFVRFADYEEPLRVDLPACCVGLTQKLGDLEAELADPAAVVPIVEMLMDDYGGIDVYNALAYAVDREVRLGREKMYEVYLPLIAELLGEKIRLDRSERRFA